MRGGGRGAGDVVKGVVLEEGRKGTERQRG